MVITGLKTQNFKFLKKASLILFLFLIQITAKSQLTDSISYDYSSEIKIRTSNKINNFLEDDYYQYNNEKVIATETWWQKILKWITKGIATFFKLIDKGGKPLEYIFYIAIFGLFIFVLTKLLGVNYQSLFLKSKKIKLQNVEFFEEDIHAINFNKVITDAEKSNNFRKAIRYLYIYYLKHLTDAELIEWQPNKTNRDYQKEMQKTKLFSLHNHLTSIYEHIWYGEFTVDKIQYKKYNKDFKNAFNSIAN